LSGTAVRLPGQTTESTPLWKSLAAAAIEGCIFWLVYGTVEFFICTLVPLLQDSLAVTNAVTWRWTALLLALYAVAGALTAAVGTLSVHLWERAAGNRNPAFDRRVERYSGALALAILFITGQLLRYHPRRIDQFFLVLAVAVAVVLGAACYSDRWEQRFAPILRPWPVAFLLLLPSATSVEVLTAPLFAAGRVAICFAVVGLVVVAAWVWQRVRRPLAGSHHSTAYRLAGPPAAMAILAGCTLLISSQRSFNLDKSLAQLSGTAHGRPNVVLLTLDTVRADHTFAGGYHRDTTPNLRRFAQNGVVYTHLFATSDTTLSTHASMFTGLYPRQHGAILPPSGEVVGRPLAPTFDTLAKILAAHGYATMGLAANSGFLTSFWGLTQGFQAYDVHSLPPLEQTGTAYLRALARTLLSPLIATQDMDLVTRRSEEINRDAFALLDAVQKKGTSFFLFLNYMDAHQPYVPPPPFDRQFPGKDPQLIAPHYHDLEGIVERNVRSLTEKERQALVSQYDGGIAYEDWQLSRLLDKLKSLGLYENTLIIITADHGEHHGDHQLLGHSKSVYQSLIHVPLVIKYPGQQQAAVIDTPISQIDFLPTILATVGIPVPPALTGLDLRTISTAPPRALVSAGYMARGFMHQITMAFIANGMKYIDSTLGTRELFDLSRDPDEQTNLYRADDPLSRSMRAGLSEWLKKVPAFQTSEKNIDSESIRRLKGLGYVQ
jgi:arylsulfatase A-like enzyme